MKGSIRKTKIKAYSSINIPNFVPIKSLEEMITFFLIFNMNLPIVCSMVHVVDMQDYAFLGRWRFNPRKKKD